MTVALVLFTVGLKKISNEHTSTEPGMLMNNPLLSRPKVGTLLCGISNSMVILIAARALAGMGGGGLTTLSSVILTDLVPLRNRGLYQGVSSSKRMGSIAFLRFMLTFFSAGDKCDLRHRRLLRRTYRSVLCLVEFAHAHTEMSFFSTGGVLNDTRGWRFAFLIQIPFLVVALVLVLWLVNIELPKPAEPQSKRQKLASVDFLGSITIALAVSSVLISLSLMSANDFSIKNPFVWGGFVVSAISWAAFFFVESKVARQPVLPLRLLDNRTGCSVAFTNLFLVRTGCELWRFSRCSRAAFHFP